MIALDGDRDHDLASGEFAQVTVRRDGPRVFDTNATMRWAVAKGMMGPGQLGPVSATSVTSPGVIRANDGPNQPISE
ncbi:MAG: hypothetical protein CM15mP120_06580 [Pseudomonadota bacterium]|nr:MAG: hypothetical protein CM15mP120_06580 [Pseudomonadota bacterium]